MDALLAVVADALYEILAQVFRLLSGYLLRYHGLIQALFVGDAGGCEINVDFVLLF